MSELLSAKAERRPDVEEAMSGAEHSMEALESIIANIVDRLKIISRPIVEGAKQSETQGDSSQCEHGRRIRSLQSRIDEQTTIIRKTISHLEI